MSVFFDGRLLVTPTTASRVDDSAMYPQGTGVQNNVLALLGHSEGGKPNTALKFRNPTDAAEVLRSGELLESIRRAFNPSSQASGPAEIIAVRVDPASQASLDLLDSTGAVALTLLSNDYGAYTGQIRVKVEAGTNKGLRLTTSLNQGVNQGTFTGDDVYRDVFSVQYTGSAASARMSINGTAINLEAPTGTNVATLELSIYATVQALVDKINTITGFTASVLDNHGAKATLNALDYVTNQDVKTAAYTVTANLQAAVDWFNSVSEGYVSATRGANAGKVPAVLNWTYMNGSRRGFSLRFDFSNMGNGFVNYQTVKVTVDNTKIAFYGTDSPTNPIYQALFSDFPTIQALVDNINSGLTVLGAIWTYGSGFHAAVLDGSGSVSSSHLAHVTNQVFPAGPLVAAAPVFLDFQGGSNGTTTNSDWANALAVLQAESPNFVVPISGDATIHAMTDAHVQFMSSVGRSERRAFVGGALGLSDSQVKAAAKAIDSDRTAMVHLGVYDYDASGALQLYPPYIHAAIVAGAFCGVTPGTAMTNKSLNIQGIERKLRNPTDTDSLIQDGVLCTESTADGFKVVRSVTTWQQDARYNRVEMSCGVAVDYTMQAIRKALDPFRGQKNGPTLMGKIIEATETTLRNLAKPEPIGPEVLVGDSANPAYKNIQVKVNGDITYVEFSCSPVIPDNYILITSHLTPYSGSSTGA